MATLNLAGQNFIKMNEVGITQIPPGSPYLRLKTDACGCQYVIGYGQSFLFGQAGTPTQITPAQAQQYFNQSTGAALQTLNSTVTVPLTPMQTAGCVDYIYNAGPGAWERSGIAQALNSGNLNEAAYLMRNATCRRFQGNINRRDADAALILNQGSINPATGAYVG